MDYISAEEFLKQDKDVQVVLLDWWNPGKGDIVYDKKSGSMQILELNYKDNEACKNLILYSHIPLLTEGQLRKFIEDKTGCKISIISSVEDMYYIEYDRYRNNKNEDLCRFVYVDEVLEGLWSVALKLAEECIEEWTI
ncbi:MULTISPECIES: hypothetical protein [unclassified Clostridium]|uniref:hypothetical protein n=1 Tax=unclassified Clostridium TaxID=2614128 RepID=UPI00029847AB|nr:MULTISPECIES: hypothetical protein [unclassified Clostridium]EKQ51590.1 MAG: hypothetical protein A370_04768 [Clostridium sp. Maddingley MBC34-26]